MLTSPRKTNKRLTGPMQCDMAHSCTYLDTAGHGASFPLFIIYSVKLHLTTLTTDRKLILLTCVQMATLALHPNEVLTARGERPKPENRVEKAVVRFILGLSSATTTQFLTHVRLTPLACKRAREQNDVKKGIKKSFDERGSQKTRKKRQTMSKTLTILQGSASWRI